MVLHYINEFSFFFFVAMSMTFTDFVTDIPTRSRTGSMLSTFMFMVLSLNVLICSVAIIWTNKLLGSHSDNSVVPTEEEEAKPQPKGSKKGVLAKPEVGSSERVGLRESNRSALSHMEDFQLQRYEDDDRPMRMDQLLDKTPSPFDEEHIPKKNKASIENLIHDVMQGLDDNSMVERQTNQPAENNDPGDDQLDLFYAYLNRVEE